MLIKKVFNKKTILPVIIVVLCVAALMLLIPIGVLGIDATVTLSSMPRIVASDEVRASEYDCILVLGAGVKEDGKPSDMLEDRLLVGIELYKNAGGKAKLLMSGDHGSMEYDEVSVMRAYAVAAGVPSEDIFSDHAGFSTYESIYRAKEIFGARRIVIVTQEYHLYRALYIADSFDIEAVGVSADLREYRGQIFRAAREVLARNKDLFMCILKPEPTYLGERIPLDGNGNVTLG